MTTKELFKKYYNYYKLEEGDSERFVDKEDFELALIEFAKFHVTEAIKEISRKVDRENYSQNVIEEAYPLTNIK